MALLQWIWVALSALGAISVRDSMDDFSGEQASARGALQIGSSAGRKHVLPSSGDGVLGTSEEGEEAGDLQADEEDKEDKEETNDAPDSAEDAEEDDKDEDGEQDAGSEAQSALREAGRKHGEAKYVYKTATEGFGDLDKVVESIDAAADDASAKAKTVDKDYAAYQGRMADTGRILDTLSLSGEQFKKEVVDYFARAEEDKFSPLAKRVQEKMAAHNATSPNVRDEGADDDKGEGDAVEEPDDASGAAPTKGAHGDQNEGDAVEESEEATDKAPTKGADKKSAGEDVEESEDASGKAPTKGEDAGN